VIHLKFAFIAASKKMRRAAVICISLAGLIVAMQNRAFSAQTVRLAWLPSADPQVTGYNIYQGTASGAYTRMEDVGNATTAVISNLTAGTTYFFAVTAYDAIGLESLPSNEASCTVPLPTVSLSLSKVEATASLEAFAIASTGSAPAQWALEMSRDLKLWNTITLGTNSTALVTVAVCAAPATFFRLKSDFHGVSLVTRKAGSNGLTNSFFITTTSPVPSRWTLESSNDLKIWSPAAMGTNSPVNVAVIPSTSPAMFFRLKGE
jgi:hypothetical protein